STGRPRKTDKDVLTLICMPRASGDSCPTTTTTTTSTTVTTTTTTAPCVNPTACMPASNAVCEPLVNDGQGIPGTYQMLAVEGPKLCQTNTPNDAKRYQPCSTDADCGGGGLCSITPFATADGVVLPFPQGIKTVFTI